MPLKKRGTSKSALKPVTSIIIPVLNEADNILPLVKRVKKAIAKRRVEILFVDDSKNNKTVARVKLAKLQFNSKSFEVNIYHRKGSKKWGGLSGSVIDGIAKANSDRIIVMDGDLQHPPETLPSIIEAGKHHDIVVASRYREGGSASGLDGGLRFLISQGSTLLAKAFFPIRLRHVSDPMTGFFLVNRAKLNTTKLKSKGFKILLEILATHPKLSVTEVPLQFAERQAGKSNGSLARGLEYLNQLVSLRFGKQVQLIDRLPKFIQFGLIGGSVFAIGMALLYTLIEILHVPVLPANAAQLAVTFWLNYMLNRRITWRERSVSKLAAHKFLVSRAATTILNFFLFAWLISQHVSFSALGTTIQFSMNYLVANIIALVVILLLNFIISDKWAFADNHTATESPGFARRIANQFPSRIYFMVALMVAVVDFGIGFNPLVTISTLMALAGLFLFAQSSMEVWRMVYAYREPESIDQLRFPELKKAQEKFCLIVPARHESAVLGSTLRQLAKQTHPRVSIITVICDDDFDTLSVALEVATQDPRVKLITYPLLEGSKPSKPKQLNYVFEQIKGQGYSVIGVIDAEDTVHEDLLLRIDTAFRDRSIGIVQGGVQLINHDSSWYSLHNVLEYYRWFNSGMSFQANNKFIPLGGNTIFVREKLLRKAGGWPETLTEDCSLGVLLSTRFKAKTAVYYEPLLATREETPGSIRGLFKQRVRWNQGFFHEWRKGIWKEMPTFRQRLLADYVLLSPVLLAMNSLMISISLMAILYLEAPVLLVMLMYLPMVPAALHLVMNAVMLRDFGKVFQRKVKIRHYAILLTTQIAYQILLNTAAFWAVIREIRGDQSWYKTPHTGKHRTEPAFASVNATDMAFAMERTDA